MAGGVGRPAGSCAAAAVPSNVQTASGNSLFIFPPSRGIIYSESGPRIDQRQDREACRKAHQTPNPASAADAMRTRFGRFALALINFRYLFGPKSQRRI